MASDRDGDSKTVHGSHNVSEIPTMMLPSRSKRMSNSVNSRSRRESFSNYPSGFGTNPLEAASRQSNHAYDEEALKWAALEKLPTYDRIRTSVFQQHTGSVKQVDVKDLSMADFQHLLQKVHRNQDDEDDQLIVKMRKRLDRYSLHNRVAIFFHFRGLSPPCPSSHNTGCHS